MEDDIRPKGSVQVQCSHPGCGWSFWLEALDQRLPDGPFDCGTNHTAQVRFNRAMDRLEAAGLALSGGVGTGCGCSGGPDDGPGAVTIRLHDPDLEYRYEHGGNQNNYGKGRFAVFQWAQLSELEQASLDPKAYDWVDWETAWGHPAVKLPGGTTPKADN